MFGVGREVRGRKGPRSQGEGCAGSRCPAQRPVAIYDLPPTLPLPNISHLALCVGVGRGDGCLGDHGGVPRTK